jgi:hypothetical protein
LLQSPIFYQSDAPGLKLKFDQHLFIQPAMMPAFHPSSAPALTPRLAVRHAAGPVAFYFYETACDFSINPL